MTVSSKVILRSIPTAKTATLDSTGSRPVDNSALFLYTPSFSTTTSTWTVQLDIAGNWPSTNVIVLFPAAAVMVMYVQDDEILGVGAIIIPDGNSSKNPRALKSIAALVLVIV